MRGVSSFSAQGPGTSQTIIGTDADAETEWLETALALLSSLRGRSFLDTAIYK